MEKSLRGVEKKKFMVGFDEFDNFSGNGLAVEVRS